MKKSGLTAIVLAVAMTAACNSGSRQSNENANTSAVGTSGEGTPRGVQRFINDVVAGGTAEIELSRMAEQKSTNAEVKKYAETMVRDHTAAGNEFKQVLSRHNVQATEAMDEKHRDLSQELSRLNGSEFDHKYMEAMVQDHRQMEDMLESRANEKPNNPPLENDVNQWAAKTLPTVKRHLEMAQQLENRVQDTPRRNTTQ